MKIFETFIAAITCMLVFAFLYRASFYIEESPPPPITYIQDPETKCQYIKSGNAMYPRLDASKKHMGCVASLFPSSQKGTQK